MREIRGIGKEHTELWDVMSIFTVLIVMISQVYILVSKRNQIAHIIVNCMSTEPQ